MTDQQLINAIDQDLQLKTEPIKMLPESVNAILLNEYSDRYIWSLGVSARYGYKVGLERVADMSDHSLISVYFNKEGRKLKSDPRDVPVSASRPCFEMQFPLTYVLPDGSTVSGNNSESIRSQLGDFYRGSAGSDQRPRLKFPVTVSYNNALIEVSSEEDLQRLNDECDNTTIDVIGPSIESGQNFGTVVLPGTGESCFKLIYPVTLNLSNGDSVAANNEEELTNALNVWSSDHSNTTDRPKLKFPFKILLGDTIMTIADESDLHRAESACDSDDGRPGEGSEESGGEGDGGPDTNDQDGNG